MTIDSKVILCGDSMSGKTSLICRAISNDFDLEMPTTIGACFPEKRVELPNVTVNLLICDTAGRERFRSLAPFYYRGTIVAILVFTLTDLESLDYAKKCASDMKKEIDEMPALFLVGNNRDLIEERTITSEQGEQAAKEINAIYYEVSSNTGFGVEELFEKVAYESAKKLLKEKFVVSSIQINLNFKALKNLKIENICPYIQFAIKGDESSVKKTVPIENSINPFWDDSFVLIFNDKKTDILTINMFNKSPKGDTKLMDEIELPIRDCENCGKFDISILNKKKKIGLISLQCYFIDGISDVKSKPSIDELENKIEKYQTEIDKKDQEHAAELEKQRKEHKNELSELQKKINEYEAELKKQTDEHRVEFAKKTEEIKELQQKIHDLIKEHDKKMKKVKEEIENHQISKTTKGQSLQELKILDLEDIKNLEKIEKIGSGGGGEVYKVAQKEFYALKIMKGEDVDISSLRNFFKEYEILNMLNHPNILKTHGIFFSDETTPASILLDYCPKNLYKVIKNKELTNIQIVEVIYQIVEGMKYVHFQKIIHRDLKPSNILITDDGVIKICDFGISKIMSAEEQSMTFGIGTQKFMAPEIVNESNYNEKADVYSFGVLVFFVLNGGEMPRITIPQIGNGIKAKIPQTFTSLASNLIDLCWNFDPKDRPTFDDILTMLEKNEYSLLPMADYEKNEVVTFVKNHKSTIPKYSD